MPWQHFVSSAWNGLKDADSNLAKHDSVPAVLGDATQGFSKIGAVWSAAQNASIGKFHVGQDLINAANLAINPADAALNALPGGIGSSVRGGVLNAVNGLYSYGVARPLSTAAQQSSGDKNFGSLFSAGDWNEAWNRSAGISPGQAAVTWFDNNMGIGPKFTQADDPFADNLDQQRQHYFQNTWGGKLTSGALDLVSNVIVDPLALGGKTAKAGELASNTIRAADRDAAIDAVKTGQAPAAGVPENVKKGSGKFNIPGRVNDAINQGIENRAAPNRPAASAAKVQDLVNKIAQTPVHRLATMPEFESSPSSSALAVLFAKAKADNPTDMAAQKSAITDVLGAAWGDQTSMDNLVTKQKTLGALAQNLSASPKGNMAAAQLIAKNGNLGSLDIFNTMTDKEIDARTTEIGDYVDNIRTVLADSGEMQMKTGTTLPEKIGEKRQNKAFAPDQTANQPTTRTTWLTQGLASTSVRVMSNQLADKLPNHINVADPVAGYGQLLQHLGAMKYSSNAVRTDLAQRFTTSRDPAARIKVLKDTRAQMVVDAGRHYGMNPEQIKTVLDAGENQLAYIRSNLQTKMYSAMDAGKNHVAIYDPLSDEISATEIPLMRSQLEDHMAMPDPKLIDRELKRFTGNTWAAKYLAPSNLSFGDGLTPKGTKVIGDYADAGEAAMSRMMGVWKDAALMRLAYPLRIQTDSFFRQLSHMELSQFLATRAPFTGTVNKGRRAYWLTSREDQALQTAPATVGPAAKMTGKDFLNPKKVAKALGTSNPNYSVKNIFKPGDYKSALRDTLTRDLGVGSRFNLTEADIDDAMPHILENGGGVGDIYDELMDRLMKKKRSGDFSIRHPQDQGWMPDYLRAVNRQIRNSPTAHALMQARGNQGLITQSIENAMSTAGGRAGGMVDEYRKVGRAHGSVQEYVAKVAENNDYYLPHPDMQAHVLNRALNVDTAKSWYKGSKKLAEPMDVHGEGYSLERQSADLAKYDQLRAGWYEFAASAPENVMARAPLFMDSYRKRVKLALDNIDDVHLTNEKITNIRVNAMRGARKDMGKILFDASHVSNLAHSMKFISPFFAAWEDTMRKWGSLMYDDPSQLAYLSKISQSPNDVGNIPGVGPLVVDDNGNRVDSNGRVFDKDGKRLDTDKNYQSGNQYIFLPKKFTSKLPGGLLEGGLKVRKDSVNSIFQGDPWWLPGFGPMVQVPANSIVKNAFPTEAQDPILKYVLPYGTTSDSPETQLLPKWVKTAQSAFGKNQDYAQQYSIFLAQATIDERNGGPKVDPTAIGKKTRNFFIMKAVVDNASPVSVQPDAKYQFYIDQAHAYQQTGDPEWETKFFKDFPQYGEMAISLSANNTGIVASNAAYPAIQKYRKDIAADPKLGWMFVGPANSGDFSNGVFNWEKTHDAGLGQNFRSKKDPTQALNDLEAARGWDKWNSFNTAITNALKQRGLHSITQNGAEDLQWAKSQYKDILSAQNKSWGADLQNSAGSGKAGALIDSADDFINAHPDVKSRTDMVALQKYAQLRQAVKNVLATRQYTSLANNPDLQYALDTYGTQLSEENLGFQAMWNRVLQFDDLSDLKVANAGS